MSSQQNKPKKKKNMMPGRAMKKHKPMPTKPPNFEAKISKKHTFRFTSSASGIAIISTQDLFATLLVNAVPQTSAVSAYTALKLRKVCLWQTGNTTGQGTVSLEANNTMAGIGAKPVLLSDTSNNNSSIARLTYVPNSLSTLGQWQNVITNSSISGGGELIITANQGDTMDITLEFYLNTDNDTYLNVAYTSLNPYIELIGCPLPVSSPKWTPVNISI
jgi:hypothetical protein